MSDPNMSNEEIDDLLLQVEEIDKISMDFILQQQSIDDKKEHLDEIDNIMLNIDTEKDKDPIAPIGMAYTDFLTASDKFIAVSKSNARKKLFDYSDEGFRIYCDKIYEKQSSKKK